MAEDKSIDSAGTPAATDGEVIDLEDLVRDLGSPSAAAGESAVVQTQPASVSKLNPKVELAPPTADEAALAAQVDEALAIEAPDLMLDVAEMRASNALASGPGTAIAIDSESIAVIPKPKGFKNIVRAIVMAWDLKLRAFLRSGKDVAARFAKDGKGALKEIAHGLKVKLIVSFKAMRVTFAERRARVSALAPAQKFVYLFSAIVFGLALLTGYLTFKGSLLPSAKREWVASFVEIADGVFTYEEGAGFEDFNDPLHHPEYVVLFERMVINLARSETASADARPMAAFELYIQTENQEAAIELKDRKVEVRDTVGRAAERMTYSELSSEEGKAKLKLLIRKELNEKLIKGRVRRVYFKTIVLNPEET